MRLSTAHLSLVIFATQYLSPSCTVFFLLFSFSVSHVFVSIAVRLYVVFYLFLMHVHYFLLIVNFLSFVLSLFFPSLFSPPISKIYQNVIFILLLQDHYRTTAAKISFRGAAFSTKQSWRYWRWAVFSNCAAHIVAGQ